MPTFEMNFSVKLGSGSNASQKPEDSDNNIRPDAPPPPPIQGPTNNPDGGNPGGLLPANPPNVVRDNLNNADGAGENIAHPHSNPDDDSENNNNNQVLNTDPATGNAANVEIPNPSHQDQQNPALSEIDPTVGNQQVDMIPDLDSSIIPGGLSIIDGIDSASPNIGFQSGISPPSINGTIWKVGSTEPNKRPLLSTLELPPTKKVRHDDDSSESDLALIFPSNDGDGDPDPKPSEITLSDSDMYTQPSIEELNEFYNTSQNRHLVYLVVGHRVHGEVALSGVDDISGMDLSKAVEFRHGGVTIHPGVSYGPMTVILYNMTREDFAEQVKITNRAITDEELLIILRDIATAMEAIFDEYDESSETWSFVINPKPSPKRYSLL